MHKSYWLGSRGERLQEVHQVLRLPVHATLTSPVGWGAQELPRGESRTGGRTLGRAGQVGLLPGALRHGQHQLAEQGEHLELSEKEEGSGQDGCHRCKGIFPQRSLRRFQARLATPSEKIAGLSDE